MIDANAIRKGIELEFNDEFTLKPLTTISTTSLSQRE